MSKPTHNYDESKIKTLSSIEHIRARTGMYIGRTGSGSHYDDGIYVLLKEVVDNGIDEHIMGYGSKLDVTLDGADVTVRDYGRGIPHGKVIECVSRINTGAKYNDDVFQFSVGLNGVGTKAVNALSDTFTVCSYRGGEFFEATFEKGELVSQDKGKADEPDGTLVTFTPDGTIFKKFKFREEYILRRLKFYTYLNAGLTVRFNGKRLEAKKGLLDLILEESDSESIYPPLHYKDNMMEIALTHAQLYGEENWSFVNGQFTADGGTHLSAFREGVLKAFNEFSKKKYDGDDVREGLIGAIAIRLKEPIFESQTKNKLGNSEIRSDVVNKVRDVIVDMLHKNPKAAERAFLKIEETQKMRKEITAVKKMAREKSKAISIRIPQLKDCRIHLDKQKDKGHESMIFITEGQSAAGSMVSCRDPNTQAIFTLKGKPLNVAELKRDAIYKNDELYNLMQALRIEETVESLRYQKVVLATDADVDGMHIRNLLITFFLKFFQPLVREGHLMILETPLFRVRNKKETRYCFSEEERVLAFKEVKNPEITRFKGLGEISPKEFREFISEGMRLSPVHIDDVNEVQHILKFYMGKNTPQRREYILNHLEIEEDAV
jgi:DNA gyrase/topoisomerase IV subunit B